MDVFASFKQYYFIFAIEVKIAGKSLRIDFKAENETVKLYFFCEIFFFFSFFSFFRTTAVVHFVENYFFSFISSTNLDEIRKFEFKFKYKLNFKFNFRFNPKKVK